MQNNVNSLSFKANLKPLIKIKNKSAFVEAKDMFKNATQNYPNDSVYITRNSLGETTLNLHNDTYDHFYTNKNIGTKNIDKQIADMGIDGFTDKLIKMFDALKLQEETILKLTNIKKEVLRLIKIMELNKNAAKNWKSEGKYYIAERYSTLAKNNQGKIDQLKSEEQRFTDEYNKKIDDLSKQYKEIIQLRIK